MEKVQGWHESRRTLTISVRLASALSLTSTSHPSSLPTNKAPSSKTYRLKWSTAYRSSPRHDGEVSQHVTIYLPHGFVGSSPRPSCNDILFNLKGPYTLDETQLNDEKRAIWLCCNTTKSSDNSAFQVFHV